MVFTAHDNPILTQVLELGKTQSILTAQEILNLGGTKKQIKQWVKANLLLCSAEGIYETKDAPWSQYHTEVKVTAKYPQGIICLANALVFHECTTQLPSTVSLALPFDTHNSDYPELPIKTIYMQPNSYLTGIETHLIEGKKIKIYNLAKTVVDCFEFHTEIGMDVAIEAVEEVIRTKRCAKTELIAYAEKRDFNPDIQQDFDEAVANPEKIFIFI